MEVTTKYQPLWRVRLRLMLRSLVSSWAMFKESKIGMTGLGIIIIFGVMGFIHPILMDTVWNHEIYDPITGYAFDEPHGIGSVCGTQPSSRHLLGTDPNGRDVLSQLMYSTRAEFALGILAALITVVLGTIVGCMAAYYGGFTDTFFMRLADVIMLFPTISFLIVLGALTQLDLYKLALVLGLIGGFGGITLILKSQALTVKVKPYIEAARVAGGNNFHIIFRHIVPNVLPLSFLYMMFNVTNAIFSEAVLSFFGLLDVKMSWGIMFNTSYDVGCLAGGTSLAQYWWLWVPPGMSITLLCTAFYLVGRGLDEIVNPRLRKR